MNKVICRFAEEADVGLILQFIRDLAEYENMLPEVVATEELLREWIFEKKKAEVIFAVMDGVEVGFALFFHNFSTFLGRGGIYLEDLFVKPEFRGKGCGKGLLRQTGMVLSGLEQAQHRFLSQFGCAALGGLDGIPCHGKNPD